jgi:hypothetical protein
LLELFNAEKVECIIVGGYALAYHGVPRYTGDIDIFVKPDILNAKKILNALEKFGFGSAGITVDDLCSKDKVIQLGVSPIRVDLITSITGVSWDDAIKNVCQITEGEVSFNIIGLSELKKNKRLTGRAKDISDLEALGE